MSTMVKTVSNIGNEVFRIFENIVHGIAQQTRNTKDMVKLVFLAFIVADILTLGHFGIVTYLIGLGKELITVVTTEVSKAGYELLILAFLLLLYKSDRKRR